MAGGNIKARVSCIRFDIEDTGSGISPAIMEKLYEPLFTTKEAGDGTGLGLSVVHGIVFNHNGGLVVESALGVGTVFSVFIPTGHRQAQPAAPAIEAKDMTRNVGRVLVVDDDEDFSDMIAVGLERRGFDVTVCGDPKVALNAIEENPNAWDIIVSDQTMPKMKGSELIASIKAHRPELPCVICTGFSKDFSREQAVSSGVDDFIEKPILPHRLAQRLSRLLMSR